MELSTLIAERDAVKLQFDEQSKIKNDAEVEQLRLQGAYNKLTELIEREEAKTVEKGNKK